MRLSILYTAVLSRLETDTSHYSVLKPRGRGENAAIVTLASHRYYYVILTLPLDF